MTKIATPMTAFFTETPQQDGQQNGAQMEIVERSTAGDIWELQRAASSKIVALTDRA